MGSEPGFRVLTRFPHAPVSTSLENAIGIVAIGACWLNPEDGRTAIGIPDAHSHQYMGFL
jgi:hypothetical protein